MTRLILHLGDHKTGTSTLQRLFAAGHGPAQVLYPRAGRANGVGHHNLAWEIGADPRFTTEKGTWRDIWREVSATAPETVLISSEAFEFKRPDRAMALITAGRPPSIEAIDGIVYLRPHAPRLLSSFAERVKRGIGPFDRAVFLDQALRGPRFQFAPRIQRWRRHFAPGCLDIRVFSQPHLTNGDIVADFFEKVLHAPLPSHTPGIRNETPDAISLQMMQMQGAAFSAAGGPSAARARARSIRAAARSFGNGPRPQWTAAEAKQIRRACKADALALDGMLGHDIFSTALDQAVRAAVETPVFSEPLSAAMADAAIAAARSINNNTCPKLRTHA